VSKTLLDSFGIDVSRASVLADGSMIRFLSGIFGGASAAVGQITGTGPGGVPLSSVGAVVGGTVPAAAGAGGNVTVTYDANNRPVYTTTYGTVPGRGVTNIGIDAKHNNELVKILAQPTVMALSGQEGSFLAGGKIFIPIVQNSNGASTITLQEEEFGVGLRFTPTVLDHGRINLRVSPEVSELSTQGVSVSASSTGSTSILPLITTRRASTTVQLHDGQSFIIGGLIKNNVTQNIHAFPILGELPIIGALFRSTEFQSDKSELVFLITPHIAKALPPDYKLPTDHFVEPSRSEMFLHGKMEGDAAPAADPASNPAPNPAPATAPVATPTPKPVDAPSGSESK
jgi:pilus assembly protein CpaC